MASIASKRNRKNIKQLDRWLENKKWQKAIDNYQENLKEVTGIGSLVSTFKSNKTGKPFKMPPSSEIDLFL